jgi:acyl carrier protein phosphodiesterase
LNYLAHAYLSFNHPELQIGNLLGDFVKGNKHLAYSPRIQEGILLHRFIDSYTDQHPLILESIKVFKPTFRLSGGVFVDILFDHFLANDPRYFTTESLYNFTDSIYQNIAFHEHVLDEKMRIFFGYMRDYNWLYLYKDLSGIEKSIRGICKRHPLLGDANIAMQIIEEKYDILQLLYSDFFPTLEGVILKKIQ